MKKFFCGERVFVLLELSLILFFLGCIYYGITQLVGGKWRTKNYMPMLIGLGLFAIVITFTSTPALQRWVCDKK